MNSEYLMKINKKEASCIIGKWVKNIETSDGKFVITLDDGSTLSAQCNIFEFQMIYENKKD